MRDEPIFTQEYHTASEFRPEQDAIYVYGTSPEERTSHISSWSAEVPALTLVPITGDQPTRFTIGLGDAARVIDLRSRAQLRGVLTAFTERPFYLDLTGLSHHVWAPLLRVALELSINVRAVYVEPGDYRFSSAPTEGEIFDLSERINGISPLPGFVSLEEPFAKANTCFVPLLGFEGTRFAYVLEHVQPPGERIVPVVGLPGFRPEYPFYTYHGNKTALSSTKAWRNVRFAPANCPFALFYLLRRIRGEYEADHLVVAPIGTKPHGLGAVLYYLASSESIELVYDHPIRKAARTAGSSRLLVYLLSAFLSPRR